MRCYVMSENVDNSGWPLKQFWLAPKAFMPVNKVVTFFPFQIHSRVIASYVGGEQCTFDSAPMMPSVQV